jgi:acetyltransferase
MLKLNDGYELIVGSSPDPQFGPVLLFGTGGTLVEVFKDRALGLPPLNTTLARRMMERTKIYTALRGVRGRDPVDLEGLEALMVRFSQLVVDQPWIQEIDINPLFASAEHLVALDARVLLYEQDVSAESLPKLAIRPYPSQHIQPYTSKNGEEFLFRPIRPEDEPKLVKFHEQLSEQSVYMRYFRAYKLDQRVAHERLTRICFVDYDRDIVLVVEKDDDIIAVGRLSKARTRNEAEFALLVTDAYQRHGLGSELLRRLLAIGREEGVAVVTAYILDQNWGIRGHAATNWPCMWCLINRLR